MTNEELKSVENAARKGDVVTVEATLDGASSATDYHSYNANAVVAQLIRSGLYPALDKLIDKGCNRHRPLRL